MKYKTNPRFLSIMEKIVKVESEYAKLNKKLDCLHKQKRQIIRMCGYTGPFLDQYGRLISSYDDDNNVDGYGNMFGSIIGRLYDGYR